MHDNWRVKRFTPTLGLLAVVLFIGAIMTANYALSGGFGRADYERVGPDRNGQVKIDVADLEELEVRFFRFLNSGNQEVKFFVGRDEHGLLHVAFDASETDYKRKRGFRSDGEWIVNNKCDTAGRLSEVNRGNGGCRPIPLKHRVNGQQVVLAETDILTGWRYFR